MRQSVVIAHCLVAINADPPFLALTALAVGSVVVLKTFSHEILKSAFDNLLFCFLLSMSQGRKTRTAFLHLYKSKNSDRTSGHRRNKDALCTAP